MMRIILNVAGALAQLARGTKRILNNKDSVNTKGPQDRIMSRAVPLALLAAAFGTLAFVGSPSRVQSSSTALQAVAETELGLGDPQRSGGLLEQLGILTCVSFAEQSVCFRNIALHLAPLHACNVNGFWLTCHTDLYCNMLIYAVSIQRLGHAWHGNIVIQ